VLIAGSRRRSWLGGVDGGTAAAEAGELRRQRSCVARRAIDLRQELTARLILLSVSAIDSGTSDANRLALCFRNADGFVERERARSTSTDRDSWRRWRNDLGCRERGREHYQGNQGCSN